jgi:uncharacterized UBP type Zn finger protein
VWNVTVRNGRKLKKYIKVPSKLLGIFNQSNGNYFFILECYIITIVHLLQKSELIQNLLDKYKESIKGKHRLLDELRMLFNEVAGNRIPPHSVVAITYLRKYGPEEFMQNNVQQDAYEYLTKLIDMMEVQMRKVPGMIEEFKAILEID